MKMIGLTSSGTGIKVLYVEDDRMARKLLCTMISMRFPGIEVISAENGTQGLQLYQQHRPDIVLTDIRMPEMDGVSMAEEIKHINKDATIIIITAHSETAHMLRGHRTGHQRYVLKPLDKTKLFQTMAEVISSLNMQRQFREQQKLLHETNERLNLVIESNGDAVFIKDLEGRYLVVNSAAASLIGKSLEEIIGQDDESLFPLETAECSRPK